MGRSAHPRSKLHSVLLYTPMVEEGQRCRQKWRLRSQRQAQLTLRLESFAQGGPHVFLEEQHSFKNLLFLSCSCREGR